MRTIFNKFDKKKISDLPIVSYEGRIQIVIDAETASKAVDYLLKQPILGFDTETRPAFKRGQVHKVSLLQVCAPDICFLFRLNQIGLPDSLIRLLSDKSVLKIGLSWHDDLRMLHQRKSFEPGTFVELQQLVHEFGIIDMSLQKLFANLFGKKISKGQRLSNWDADVLTEGQMRYAATDAWACIQIYEELCRMKIEGYHLEEVPEEINAI